MLGLGVYDSSSEDEMEMQVPHVQAQESHPIEKESQVKHVKEENHNSVQDTLKQAHSITASIDAPSGPVLGPASIERAPSEERSTGGRASPFSTSRALIQDLTLPPVPNLDIPPSPPGSPDPAANAKFERFLSLKKQGVHFNAKLASSSSLKNPSLLMKMMDHAGIDEPSQYDTSLPTDLWSTANLPPWAFKEELLGAQQEFRQKMEGKKLSGQRSSIDFVSKSSTSSSRSVSGAEVKRKGHP